MNDTSEGHLVRACAILRSTALLLSACLALAAPAHGIEAPILLNAALSEGQLRLTVSNPSAYTGFNVYRNGSYYDTRRTIDTSGVFNLDGDAARYCVTGFVDSGNQTRYSVCSNSLHVAPSDETRRGASLAPPQQLRATIYSRTAAELFWQPPASASATTRYRVIRDGENLGTIAGKSHFMSGLQPGRDYRYQISAVDGERESAPSVIAVNTTGTRTSVAGTESGSGSVNAGLAINLRVSRYSSTAAELFWEPVQSTAAIARYEVRRDGVTVATTAGRSYFDSTLSPESPTIYTVVAIDHNGQPGPAASVTVNANGGSGNVTAGFDLQLMHARVNLMEGSSTTADIRIQSLSNTGRAIELSLRPASGGDLEQLSHWFEPQKIENGRTQSTLHLALAVAAKPLGFHERHVIVQASDGITTREQTLALEITPIDRPDVYLLIGQSNMVGTSEQWAKNSAPGGPDETHPRIRQLNVRQNDRNIFYAPEKFRDAYYNVSSPLFVDAEDPLHEPRYPWTSRKEASHIGLGLSFAKAALTDTTRNIILVPAAWGASGFCDGGNGELAWNAWPTEAPGLGGTLLADRAITRLNSALRNSGGILRGILWHQGGHDSNDWRCAERYRDNLSALVNRLRSEALVDARGSAARGEGADVPFIVATQSRGSDSRGDFSRFSSNKQRVDQAHRAVSSYLTHADFVNNDDLVPGQYPCGQSSCVHFGAAALREQGERFYQALQRIWQRQ